MYGRHKKKTLKQNEVKTKIIQLYHDNDCYNSNIELSTQIINLTALKEIHKKTPIFSTFLKKSYWFFL